MQVAVLAAVIVLGHATGKDLTNTILTMEEVHYYMVRMVDERSPKGTRKKSSFLKAWISAQVEQESRPACKLADDPVVVEEPSDMFTSPLDNFLLHDVPKR